jgi:flagellar basal body-associated protein FliL
MDFSTAEGKKQAILLGVAVVALIVAGIFLYSFLAGPKWDTPVAPTDQTGQPLKPNVRTPDGQMPQ